MSVLCLVVIIIIIIIAIKETMESRMHSETRRLCPNKRFPAVQGFTVMKLFQDHYSVSISSIVMFQENEAFCVFVAKGQRHSQNS